MIFMLSVFAPGDPVLLALSGQTGPSGNLPDKQASEKGYIDMRKKLNRHLPTFYFAMAAQSQPDTFYRIVKKQHRSTLGRLIDAHGNWPEIQEYYNTVRDFDFSIQDVPQNDNTLPALIQLSTLSTDLLGEYEDGQIRRVINEIDATIQEDPGMIVLQPKLTAVKKRYNAVLSERTPAKNFIPAFHWFGTKNQYHRWLVGDRPLSYKSDLVKKEEVEFGGTEMANIVIPDTGFYRLSFTVDPDDVNTDVESADVLRMRIDGRSRMSYTLKELREADYSINEVKAFDGSSEIALLNSNMKSGTGTTFKVEHLPTYSPYHSGGFLRMDFGDSYTAKRPVIDLIKESILWTMLLSFLSVLITYLVSLPLGVFSARMNRGEGKYPLIPFVNKVPVVRNIAGFFRNALYWVAGAIATVISKISRRDVERNTLIDSIITTILFILFSLPSFWVATLLIIFLGDPDYADWRTFSIFGNEFSLSFPTKGVGRVDPGMGWWEIITLRAKHLALPLFCWTYASFAFLSRQMRGGMLSVLRQDFIRTARAKGVEAESVIWKHTFRNSLLPIITLFANVFPRMIAGSIVIELIFTIPGMGYTLYGGILSQDYPLVFTIVLMSAVLTMIGYLVADILYAVVDPRITYK